ncbi:hypothetical protein KP509_01G101400 [Ceratopteris richardii]|uniref:WRKY domain-containing protein n=1 Tax=Ceratopteris richardii TaxID=49495 RepID=A0A8T2VNN1_CERRI|nr:hypothetical protein KP509_01G101400 [Ceratopteris richardii]KAH7447319.1 hypothetical protein KP509_01G101400 [Ceratopteris richardii]
MDTPSRTLEACEGGLLMLRKPNHSLPKLSLPQRSSAEAADKGLNGSSPGPMTFVSSFFADDPYSDQKSFTQLLATADIRDGRSAVDMSDFSRQSVHSPRFKSFMPSKFPIQHSPFFTVPAGMSPSILLDSPVLFSPLQQVQPSPTTGSYPVPTSLGQEQTTSSHDQLKMENDFAFKPHPQPTTSSTGTGSFGFSHQQIQSQISSHTMASSLSPIYDSNLQSVSAPSQDAKIEPAEKPAPAQQMVPSHPLPQFVERPSEDGYNWRKYGQKQVKGGEYPRSYYKCTYPSCHVKKKVERSSDGQITEIVYKGEHNHEKPQSTRRTAMGNRDVLHSMAMDRTDAYGNASDLSTSKGYTGGVHGSAEHSQGSSSDDGAEDGDGSESNPEFKRRKHDHEFTSTVPLRTVREPRVVVQTTSEVDILDDGYRWRKYGQKVVKGNEHPRSYYKCTNVGCKVRKHVERSSKDSAAVITTYEGKHNHDVPTGRSTHNDMSATSSSRAAGPASDNNLIMPAGSLQEQYLGKNQSLVMEAGFGGQDTWNPDSGFTERGAEQFRANVVGSDQGVYGNQGDLYYPQAVGLVPKEEPVMLTNPIAGSMQPTFQDGQSPYYIANFPH